MRASVRQGLGILVTAAASFVASCDGLGITRACTLIGCDSGLLVQMQGAVPDTVTITAQAPGATAQTVVCTTSSCAQYVFFRDFTPASVTLTVRGAGIDIVRTVQPGYRVSQPNGDHCPPTCRQATVQIQVS